MRNSFVYTNPIDNIFFMKFSDFQKKNIYFAQIRDSLHCANFEDKREIHFNFLEFNEFV